MSVHRILVIAAVAGAALLAAGAPASAAAPAGTGAAAVPAAVAATKSSPAHADVVATIERKTRESNDAYRANDLKRYFALFWDDSLFYYPEGRTTLAAYRSDWTKLVESGGGIRALSYRDLRVQVDESGDAAIASYLVDVTTRYADGRETRERWQETDVWFRRGGVWKIAFIHYSPDGAPPTPVK